MFSTLKHLPRTTSVFSKTRTFIRHFASSKKTFLHVWGQIGNGSLGLGDNEQDEATPVRMPPLDDSGVSHVAFGTEHSAIVTGKGDLYTFGRDQYGQLGLGHDQSSFVESVTDKLATMSGQKEQQQVFHTTKPLLVESIKDVAKVAAGKRHTAAVTKDGSLYTWGWGGNMTAVGALGQGDKTSYSHPKKVESLSDHKCVDVACGDLHTLVLTEEGLVFAMGEGEHGRLGVGGTSSAKSPAEIQYFSSPENRVEQIMCGKEFSFAITRDGIAFGWGRNDRQQIGQGGGLAMDVYSCDRIPVDVVIDGRVAHMALGQADVIAVSDSGEVYQWGDRVFLEPVAVFEDRFQDDKPTGNLTRVALGTSVMAFVSENGELFTCNKNLGINADSYALGHGSVDPFKVPLRVKSLDGYHVVDVFAKESRMAAIVREK